MGCDTALSIHCARTGSMLTETDLQFKLNELQGQVTSQQERNNHCPIGVQGPILQSRCGCRKCIGFIIQVFFKPSGMGRIVPK
jgi:hypothetical protein